MQRNIHITLFVFLAQLAIGQDLTTVLEKYFQVSGGIEAIKKATSISKQYTYYSLYPKNDTAVIMHKAMLPHFKHYKSFSLKQEIKFESFANSNGDFLYMHKPFPNESRRTMIMEQVIDPANQILNLYRVGKLRFQKADTIINKSSWVVRTKGLNPELLFYFDKQDGHLIAERNENLKTNIVVYSDFRKTNLGLVTAFKIETLYNYRAIALEVATHIDFALPFSKADFDPKPEVAKSRRKPDSPFNKVEYLDEKLENKALPEVLQTLKGKRILIDLWATWCGPCKMEALKYDDSFYAFLTENKIEMLFITIDKKQEDANWKRDVAWFNMNGYHLLANKWLIESIQREIYGMDPLSVPRYVLVNESGDLLSKNLIRPSDSRFKNELLALLN